MTTEPVPTPLEGPPFAASRKANRRLHIFISYRREDSSGQTGRLYDSLSDHFGADNVFMDLDTIEPGEDFVEVIDDALKRCDVVLVVIGPRWLVAEREGHRRLDDPTDYLRTEVEHSLAHARRVIPVLVQEASMPRGRDLPEAIQGLARRNAFDLSDSRWRLDVGRLIDALEDIERSLGFSRPALAVSDASPRDRAAPLRANRSQAPIAPPGPSPMTSAVSGAGSPPSAPGQRPSWMAGRTLPIVAAAALLAVATIAALVVTRGSPAPSALGASGIAGASASPAPTVETPTPRSSGVGSPTVTRPPSPAPTLAPTPLPTPVPLPPGIGLGASTQELDEPFSSPGSFPVSSDANGSLVYGDGGFDITISGTNYSLWSPHTLAAGHAVLRVSASVTPRTAGSYGGVMCGSASGDYLYGSVSPDHRWAIGQILSNLIQTVDQGALPITTEAAPGEALEVRLECAATGASTDRVQLVVAGIKVADNSGMARVGPFDRAALLGSSALDVPAALHFDDLAVWSGESFREATEALRDHVPVAFRGHCRTGVEDGRLGQVAALICAPAGSIDQAEYYQYETQAQLQSHFEAMANASGSPVTGTDCRTGPSMSRYRDAAGAEVGTFACHPNSGSLGGLIYLWTNEPLRIVAAGITANGTYEDLANWWQTAGPLP